MTGVRARLVGAVLLVVVGLLCAIAAVVVQRAERALVEVDKERFSALTHQLAEQIPYAVLAESEALLSPSLESFAHSPDLVDVEVRGERGAVLARRAGPAPGPAAIEVEAPVRTRDAAPGDDGGELSAFGLEPGAARDVGVVRARFSPAATLQVQSRLRREILASFLLLGSLGVVLVSLVASSVVRRVRGLAQAAARVAGGDLTTRVEARGSDELALLARDFNAMTASLAEQRRALDEASRAIAERESLAAIGRATAVIAHELRNPLGIVLGAAEIVADPARPEAARAKAGKLVEEETRRLSAALDGLLAYARPREPTREAASALQLAAAVVERVGLPGGPAEGVQASAGGQDVRVLVDRDQVSRILWNLLQNAAQAGARTIRVTVGPRAGGGAEVLVEDDGPGVPDELVDRLFLPFVTTKQRGAGLGLAAARRMARDGGGDLRLLPGEPGRAGARFLLELPQAPPEER